MVHSFNVHKSLLNLWVGNFLYIICFFNHVLHCFSDHI
nr:MAG TPA: hypothetical protein [Caudoviricetes sp.]